MGTLKSQVAPARAVTAARMALFTVTATADLGSVSAGQGPRGSDARNANPGIFWWKAIVFVCIFFLSYMFKDGFSFQMFSYYCAL